MFISLRRMMQSAFAKRSTFTTASYEEAIRTLDGLQSNADYLKSVVNNNFPNDIKKLKDTERYLLRSGITLETLDTLSVIHVAGTKGKGSTCAFTESILRNHGFRTGFFSSPHLITVRERIRINGEPISQLTFTHYFWRLYKQLKDAKDYDLDMPTYFKFLTILMFNIFLEENIDVAIIEVGIGGEYDCTNIIRHPICVGITSLGLDHTFLLGETLREIAYQKSGIFKPDTIAYTVPQPADAMHVLQKRANEKKCELQVVPLFENYAWKNGLPHLSITGNVQRQNASLAIQLAVEWMKSRSKKDFFVVDSDKQPCQFPENVSVNKIATALSLCKWPGRTQILRSSLVDFFLDGAHTIESMECCMAWFKSTCVSNNVEHLLIFNTSGKRDTIQLLRMLKSLHFHKAYFVPNLTGVPSIEDMINYTIINEQRDKCKLHCQVWGTDAILADNVAQVLHHIKQSLRTKPNYDNKHKPQVLVTGSLHLVGAILSILDPQLTMTTNF